MDWLSRFQNIAEELRQHSQVQLLNFHTFPPIETSQIDFLENKFNTKIPSSVINFYRQTNGLQLRWVFKTNQNIDLEREVATHLEWSFFLKKFCWEEGVVMILPLQKALESKTIDAYSSEYKMMFARENFSLSISEDGTFSNDFFLTDFESYLEFLLAAKGLISRRSIFYKNSNNEELKNIFTPKSFWNQSKTLNLDQALLVEKFPFCDQVRFSESQINKNNMKLISEKGEKISQQELEKIIEEHYQFLMSGGIGGEWKVLEIRGIVTAFYHQTNENNKGNQANFERKNITKINFENVALPYSNFCATFAEGVDFSKSKFEKSLFTDSFLARADFANSNLIGVDFSRSDLRNANFQNAILENTDFENCDLRGANFEGANFKGATFIGALLKN